jgi:hypothetical protein
VLARRGGQNHHRPDAANYYSGGPVQMIEVGHAGVANSDAAGNTQTRAKDQELGAFSGS